MPGLPNTPCAVIVSGTPRMATRKPANHARESKLDRRRVAFHPPAMDRNTEFAPRGSKTEIEEGLDFTPKFDSNGLIPALAMDALTREPLMLAYMNEESLRRTLEIGEAVYWSRSRQEFWHKGATSGHIQRIVEIRTDCDQDALILLVEQIGAGACHTGRGSCFYRKVGVTDGGGAAKLEWIGPGKSFDPAAVYGKP
jgi:phosphoribosyl-AMP cyclohydrolase